MRKICTSCTGVREFLVHKFQTFRKVKLAVCKLVSIELKLFGHCLLFKELLRCIVPFFKTTRLCIWSCQTHSKDIARYVEYAFVEFFLEKKSKLDSSLTNWNCLSPFIRGRNPLWVIPTIKITVKLSYNYDYNLRSLHLYIKQRSSGGKVKFKTHAGRHCITPRRVFTCNASRLVLFSKSRG